MQPEGEINLHLGREGLVNFPYPTGHFTLPFAPAAFAFERLRAGRGGAETGCRKAWCVGPVASLVAA